MLSSFLRLCGLQSRHTKKLRIMTSCTQRTTQWRRKGRGVGWGWVGVLPTFPVKLFTSNVHTFVRCQPCARIAWIINIYTQKHISMPVFFSAYSLLCSCFMQSGPNFGLVWRSHTLAFSQKTRGYGYATCLPSTVNNLSLNWVCSMGIRLLQSMWKCVPII